MKHNSAKLLSEYYKKILDHLKEDTQNYPWKLDQLGVLQAAKLNIGDKYLL